MSTSVRSTGGEFTTIRNGAANGPNSVSGNANISNPNASQIHVWAYSNRNDTINIGFDNISGFTQGHHIRGDNKLFNHYNNNLSEDVFNFTDLDEVGQGDVVVGRLEDFGSNDDEVHINNVRLALENGSGQVGGHSWKVVEHNGNHNGSGNAEPQKWLVITTAAGGHIVYALEGARVDGSGGSGGVQEHHFVSSSVAQAIINQPAVAYVDPQNFVPGDATTTNGTTYNDYDNTQADVADIIQHGATMHTHDGNSSNDRYLDLTGNDLLAGGLNNDTIYSADGHDMVWGGSGSDSVVGGSGHDSIYGGSGNDVLNGHDDNDLIFGQVGNDTLYGGNGNDRLHGGSENDSLFGGNGNDAMWGNQGNDQMNGDVGNDFLHGGQGNDILRGGAGFDTLTGGKGDDRLVGNFNADTFVFTNDHGRDTIVDFDVTNNFERIDFSGHSQIVDFADLTDSQANHLRQFGDNLFISTGGTDGVWLLGVHRDELSENDFIF